MEILAEGEWRERAAAHAARIQRHVGPHLERRRRGEAHPVEDFLFGYYTQRPSGLLRWHPGHGVGLEGGLEYAEVKGYVVENGVATVSGELLSSRGTLLVTLRRLLRATLDRSPSFGCFGLHEWAMVYKLDPSDVRHASWPLRLGSAGTDEVVESHRISCSHFDAFRFFTEDAVPLNTLRPRSDDRPEFEQPGCLHAGMDLYKHAFRLSPLVPSELVADAFELAKDIRELDMQASPYDLRELGYEPVPIETPHGKQAYTDAQRAFAERARPLRASLLTECERLIRASDGSTAHTANVPPDRQQ